MILTIVTITKDDPDGLARTLGSSVAWRSAGVEHIVVDGGDDPEATHQHVLRLCEPITVYRQQSQGISAAFNEGLALAQGDWVWFLNGGDAIHESLDPHWLLTLLPRTQAQVVTGSIHFDSEASARRRPHLSYQWPLMGCWLAHPATLVRRETLARVGGFDPKWRIAMDYDLWMRLLRRDIVVDVLSVPFARFDVKGLSECPEMRDVARREERQIVLRNGLRLSWAGPWICLRVARRLSRALFGVVWR